MVRPIPGAKGYFASPEGKVFSQNANKGHATIEMSQQISNSGYKYVNLAINGRPFLRYIHRLIAETFIRNPEGKPQVNHIDGNKLNNRVENLEWVSQAENCAHFRNNYKGPETQTSGRRGVLYHETTPIKAFRSLQQAKEFCKQEFGCSLSTNGTENVNRRQHLIFLRNSDARSIDDVWFSLKIELQETARQVKASIKKTRGCPGTVTYNGNILHFQSIREANAAFGCCFKKHNQTYCCRDLVYVPTTTKTQ